MNRVRPRCGSAFTPASPSSASGVDVPGAGQAAGRGTDSLAVVPAPAVGAKRSPNGAAVAEQRRGGEGAEAQPAAPPLPQQHAPGQHRGGRAGRTGRPSCRRRRSASPRPAPAACRPRRRRPSAPPTPPATGRSRSRRGRPASAASPAWYVLPAEDRAIIGDDPDREGRGGHRRGGRWRCRMTRPARGFPGRRAVGGHRRGFGNGTRETPFYRPAGPPATAAGRGGGRRIGFGRWFRGGENIS